MKLLTLNLKAVGPFTDLVLDLSGGEHGLHLIYGPNEAGKTSTLRGPVALALWLSAAVGRQLRSSQRAAPHRGKAVAQRW